MLSYIFFILILWPSKIFLINLILNVTQFNKNDVYYLFHLLTDWIHEYYVYVGRLYFSVLNVNKI